MAPSVLPVVDPIVHAPAPIEALATGDFVWDAERRSELALLTRDGSLALYRSGTPEWTRIALQSVVAPIADVESAATGRLLLLPARVSGLPLEELVVLDPAAGRLHVSLGEVAERDGASPAAPIPAPPRPRSRCGSTATAWATWSCWRRRRSRPSCSRPLPRRPSP